MIAAIRVTVWNEHRHERAHAHVGAIYPDGMHAEIARALAERTRRPLAIRTATLDDPGHGLAGGVLDETDVLVWWGHRAHDELPDALAERIEARVHAGMGFVALHSASRSKPFLRLMGTACSYRWREADDRELIWVVAPGHAIARGLPPVIELPHHEMYGEPFAIPEPDELVLVSWFSGGEVFRSGCCWRRGAGRIAYLGAGHQEWPVFHQPEIRQLLANAVAWAHGEDAEGTPARLPEHAETGWFEQAGRGV
ncbi:MAG TPA: ThuA domain-containing protein [Gaiellales bacterium]